MLQWRSEFEICDGLGITTKLHSDPMYSDFTYNSGLSGFPAYFSSEVADYKDIFWQIEDSTEGDKLKTALNWYSCEESF